MRGARVGALVVIMAASMVPGIGAGRASAAPSPTPSVALTPNADPVSISIPAGPSTTKVTIMGLAVEQLTVSTTAGTLGANCDVQMTLRDPDGTAIAGPTCGGQSGTIDITALPSDGAYTLALKSTAAAAGTVHLAATSSAGPPSITPDAPEVYEPVTSSQTVRLGFTAHAGDRYSVLLRKSYWIDHQSCTYSLHIVDGDGTPVGPTGGTCSGGFLEPTTIPAGGTYFVEFAGGPDFDGGSFSPRLFQVVDTSVPITPGAPKPQTAAITAPGQVARFTFAGTKGQQFSALVTKSTLRFICSVGFERPNGTLAASASCSKPGGFLDSFRLDATGTWSVLVDPSSTNTGRADIQLFDSSDQTAAADMSGTPTAIDITQPGQNAVFSFTGTVGQQVSAHLTDVTFPALCSTNDGFLFALVRPDGTMANVRLECGNPDPTTSSYLDRTSLDQTGTWSFVVDPIYTGTGTAQLQTYSIVDQTGHVKVDGTPAGVDITEPGQNATFTFRGVAGQHVSVGLDLDQDFGQYCELSLIGPTVTDGETAACNNPSTFLEPILLDATGTWTVNIYPYGPATGTGTLRVSKVVDQHHKITAGGSAKRVDIVTAGQTASYRFNGTAGDVRTVTLSASTFPGCSSVFVSFVRPNGTTKSIKGTCSKTVTLGPVTLDASGPWTVLVDPVGPGTGAAKLKLT